MSVHLNRNQFAVMVHEHLMGELNCHSSDHKKMFSDCQACVGDGSKVQHDSAAVACVSPWSSGSVQTSSPDCLWRPSPARLLYLFHHNVFSFSDPFSGCTYNLSLYDRQMVVWREVCCGCWTTLALRLGGDWWGSGWASPSLTRSEYRMTSDLWWNASVSAELNWFDLRVSARAY